MATRLTKRSGHVEDSLACKECRRRKANCGHEIPECSTCRKYRRHCLYDRNSQTPLTRKHLTEVEYRLQRAEDVLKMLFPEAQVAYLLDPNLSGEIPVLPELSNLGNMTGEKVTKERGTDSDAPIDVGFSGQADIIGTDLGRHSPDRTLESGSSDSHYRPHDSPHEKVLSGENDCTDDVEFEWDEQEKTAVRLDSDIFALPVEGNVETAKSIVDGMATLTVDAVNSGYLGTASGASHLRTMWTETATGPARDPGTRSTRQHHILQLLKQSEDAAATSLVHAHSLVTRATSDALVDAYFNLYHPTFPAIHEPTFRAQYANTMPRPSPGTWIVLANLVASAGAFGASNNWHDDTDVAIFKTAKQYLTMTCMEVGNLTMVQIFGLMAHYLQKRNKPNSGYNYGGLALRLAIALGLHKELGEKKMTTCSREMRRRVWWSLCVLDVGATITYGRPLTWPQEGVDAALPSNLHDHQLRFDNKTLPIGLDEPTISSYLRSQCAYHLRTMKIYNRVISEPPPTAEQLLTLDDTIIASWLSRVPEWFGDNATSKMNPQYALVHGLNIWRFRNLRIVMFRPFLVRWASQDAGQDQSWDEQIATERCLQAASESITHIQAFWNSNLHARLTAFYVLYFLFQAVLIPTHCLQSRPEFVSTPSWRVQIESALEIIQSMVPINPSATRCLNVILGLCGSQLRNNGVVGLNTTYDALETMTTMQDIGLYFEPRWDAATWMGGSASMLINEDLWMGNFDNANGGCIS